MLVEDDAALGAVTVEVIELLGHAVSWCSSARTAFESLSGQHAFEVVLLDLNLGDGHAVDLVARLRQKGVRVPPLVVFSAQPADAIQAASSMIGAASSLQKPCGSQKIAAALRGAVESAGV